MQPDLPTGIAGRCLALALLLAVLGTVYILLAAPVLELYSARETALEHQRIVEARLHAAADQLPALRARLAALQASASTRKVTLEGNSDAIAAANLQSRIDELANSAGLTVASTEGLAPDDRGPYRRIGLRIALNGDYDNLLALLAEVDKATPPLVIENLQIHARLQALALARSAVAPQPNPAASRLDAGFEVYGFRRRQDSVAMSK